MISAMRWTTLLLALMTTLALACTAGDEDGDGGQEPGADAAVSAADSGTAGPLGFMEECDPADDQCDSSMELFCFGFNAKGPHCTHECTSPDQCGDPSPGCNNMGVCKAPDL